MIGVARGPVTGDRVIRFATAAVVFAVAAFAWTRPGRSEGPASVAVGQLRSDHRFRKISR